MYLKNVNFSPTSEDLEFHTYEELPSEYKDFNYKAVKSLRSTALKEDNNIANLPSVVFVSPENWVITNDKKWIEIFFKTPMKKFCSADFIKQVKFA